MKWAAVHFIASMTLLGTSFAAQRDGTFTGEITDRACARANSHDAMMQKHGSKDTASCILDCVKAGGKFVLFDAASMSIYALDDQQKPARFAGQKVRITGAYDEATKTIHVTDIQPGT